ncbi:hypothetical protein TcWFU_003291 [Taenia crassiceps]|uniref:RRM domain-containing protein n=1 Tax=Taenia crassiceps TaxID=6207 RepID=A0ABR4QCS4_9CEST
MFLAPRTKAQRRSRWRPWQPWIQMKSRSSKHSVGRKSSVSHLPRHFEEDQLRKYFAQFGTVHGIYLPRSKKEIAPIIASTVHNVLNFNRIMKCEVLERYYPSWFHRTPSTTSSVEKEKLRRVRSVLNPAENASERRVKSLRSRIAALKRLAPGFRLNMLNGSHPASTSSS